MESASYSGGRSVTLGLTDVLAGLQTDLDRTRNCTEHLNNRPVDPDDRNLGQSTSFSVYGQVYDSSYSKG